MIATKLSGLASLFALALTLSFPSFAAPHRKSCDSEDNKCDKGTYCFKGKCIKTPHETKFCYTEYCMATCNDGFVIRNLCSPCEKSCNQKCKSHGGCKDTCSRANGNDFAKECNPNP